MNAPPPIGATARRCRSSKLALEPFAFNAFLAAERQGGIYAYAPPAG